MERGEGEGWGHTSDAQALQTEKKVGLQKTQMS